MKSARTFELEKGEVSGSLCNWTWVMDPAV